MAHSQAVEKLGIIFRWFWIKTALFTTTLSQPQNNWFSDPETKLEYYYCPFKSFTRCIICFRNQTADLIADALEFMYTSWPDNSDKYALRIQLVSLVSDKEYFAPSHQVGDIHSRVSSVYMYEFARRPKTIQAAEWMGVPHAANVIWLWLAIPTEFRRCLRRRWSKRLFVYYDHVRKLCPVRRSHTPISQRHYLGRLQFESQSLPTSWHNSQDEVVI